MPQLHPEFKTTDKLHTGTLILMLSKGSVMLIWKANAGSTTPLLQTRRSIDVVHERMPLKVMNDSKTVQASSAS
eukprot:scaffold316789_cov75-Attheya_sp.AAC.1